MRALLAAALLVGACSALDNFGAFQFDGSAGGGDMTGGGANVFGDACTPNSCMQYNPMRPVSCITVMGGQTFRDGICTRVCTPGTAACSEFPNAVCAPLSMTVSYCLPLCVGGGPACRIGYDCCANNNKVNNGETGACAPSDSSLCH